MNSRTNPEEFEFFAFVVDNEVAVIYPIQKTLELYTAAWSSDPKVIKLTDEQKSRVYSGCIYNGTDFVPPIYQS
jgi:hypothetical protein